MEEAMRRLPELSQPGPEYTALLRQLLVQASLKVTSTRCTVYCRKMDLAAVKSVLARASQDYTKIRPTMTINFVVDEADFLPGPPPAPAGTRTCCGGVIVAAVGGRIRCDNTLDTRIRLAYEDNLPSIRMALFDEQPTNVSVESTEAPVHGGTQVVSSSSSSSSSSTATATTTTTTTTAAASSGK